jgi:meiosis-specific APC/C activator protein AMA1
MAESEELLVGDEFGNVYYYSVEWSKFREGHSPTAAHALIRLLRRIVVHSQQICGLAWSGDGDQFATGGNDNVACLFDTVDVIRNRNGGVRNREALPLEGGEKHRWTHGAAVKAIAFCPWQKSLLATGATLQSLKES